MSRDETNLPEAIEKFYMSVTSIDEQHKLAYVLFLFYYYSFFSPLFCKLIFSFLCPLCSSFYSLFPLFFRGEEIFRNDFCGTTLWYISKSFRPKGMLSSGPAEVGIYLISEKYKGSNKMVIPYWITVRIKIRWFYFFLF